MKVASIKICGIQLQLLQKKDVYSLFIKTIYEKEKRAIICTDFRLINFSSNRKNVLIDQAVYYPDSTGIYFALKTLYRNQTRGFRKLVSTDIHYELLKFADTNILSLYLLGSTNDILTSFIKRANVEYPDLRIAGYSNGFDYAPSITNIINSSGADILLVGMGAPKQEIWINENYNKLNTQLILSVGAFFSFYSRDKTRAPRLLRVLSLEWLFRFFQEPTRLWKRYLLEYPAFIINVIREKIMK